MSPPLPPHVIAEYQAIVPDAGERFFMYMEREQASRHNAQQLVLRHAFDGQRYVFIIALFSLVAATACAITGHAYGLMLAIGALVPLVKAVWQRDKDKDEAKSPRPPAGELADPES